MKKDNSNMSGLAKIINGMLSSHGGSVVFFIWKNQDKHPVEYVSDNVSLHLGYTSYDVMLDDFYYKDLIHHEDIDKFNSQEKDFISKGKDSFELRYRIIKKDGSIRYVYDYRIVDKNSTGEITGFSGYIIDETEHFEIQNALKKHVKSFDIFFMQSAEGLFFMMLEEPVRWDGSSDRESVLDYVFNHQKITRVNQSMACQYGSCFKDITGLTPSEIFKDDLSYGRSIWAGLFDSGRCNFESQERKADGTILWIQNDYICLYEDDGRISGCFGMCRDITARKKAEEELRQKSEELERFFTVALDLLCISDTGGYFLRVNRAWERILGYSMEDLEGKSLIDFVHPEDIPSTIKVFSALSDQIPVLNFTNRYRTHDGDYRFIEWRSYPTGRFIYSAARDITARIQFEEELNKLAERLTLATESAGIGTWDWHIENDELIWDSRMYEIYGFNQDIPVRLIDEWKNAVYIEDRKSVDAVLLEAVKRLTDFHISYRIIRPDGRLRYLEAHAIVIRNGENRAVRVTGVNRDITDNKILEEKLVALSTTDPLTSVYNRRYLLHVLNSEVSRAIRYNATFSLIMFDLDHFKEVNDTYGHDAGDEVLKEIALMVRRRIRKNDVLARWGGEEFMILLSGTNPYNARIFADMLMAELKILKFSFGKPVTASFGVTGFIMNDTIDSLLKRVDQLVYQAKNEGRNCIRTA